MFETHLYLLRPSFLYKWETQSDFSANLAQLFSSKQSDALLKRQGYWKLPEYYSWSIQMSLEAVWKSHQAGHVYTVLRFFEMMLHRKADFFFEMSLKETESAPKVDKRAFLAEVFTVFASLVTVEWQSTTHSINLIVSDLNTSLSELICLLSLLLIWPSILTASRKFSDALSETLVCANSSDSDRR